MKSIRFTLAAFTLSSAMLCFAGGQPARYYTPSKTETPTPVRTIYTVDSRTRVVLSAISRNSKAAEDQGKPVAVRANTGDSAFRK